MRCPKTRKDVHSSFLSFLFSFSFSMTFLSQSWKSRSFTHNIIHNFLQYTAINFTVPGMGCFNQICQHNSNQFYNYSSQCTSKRLLTIEIQFVCTLVYTEMYHRGNNIFLCSSCSLSRYKTMLSRQVREISDVQKRFIASNTNLPLPQQHQIQREKWKRASTKAPYHSHEHREMEIGTSKKAP